MKEIEKALRMAEPLLRSNRYLAEADACKKALQLLASAGADVDTPRTDALMKMEFDYGRQIGTVTEGIVIDFCRQLELELNASNIALEAANDLLKAGQRP